MILEGATEKVSQFIIQPKSIYNKNYVLINKNVFFKHCRYVKTIKKLNYIVLFIIHEGSEQSECNGVKWKVSNGAMGIFHLVHNLVVTKNLF